MTCTCAFGWTKEFCDEKDPCTKEYFDCGNGETSGFKIDGCTCACNTGWKKDSDEKCLNKIKACDPDDDGDDSDHPCGYGTYNG